MTEKNNGPVKKAIHNYAHLMAKTVVSPCPPLERESIKSVLFLCACHNNHNNLNSKAQRPLQLFLLAHLQFNTCSQRVEAGS